MTSIFARPGKAAACFVGSWAVALATALLLVSSPSQAQIQSTPPSTPASAPLPGAAAPIRVPTLFEQNGIARSGETVEGLGPNLMGDRIGEFTGGLSFQQTDITVPGNSALPVQVARKMSVGNRQASLGLGLFGDWDIDIPRLSTIVFADKPDWYGGVGGTYNTNRCSQFQEPPPTLYTAAGRRVAMAAYSWWGGYPTNQAYFNAQ